MPSLTTLPANIATATLAPGVFEGDVIIRTAFVEGIKDLRRNSWLLQYAFASLAQDSLTSAVYGQNSIDRAVEWFQNHEIHVIMETSPNEPKFPSITICERSGQEDGATTADVNYDTEETLDIAWPNILGPLSPTAYNPVLGKVSISSADLGTTVLIEGMVLFLKSGQTIEIIKIDGTDLYITPTTLPLDFTDLYIKSARPTQGVPLESLRMSESYGVICAVQGEPSQAGYLFSVIKFIYLRYKQRFFEARGFENSKVTYTEASVDRSYQPQFVYRRGIMLSGIVHNFWPKDAYEKIQEVDSQIRVLDLKTGIAQPNDLSWVGADDDFSFEDFGKDDPNLIVVGKKR